MVLSEGRPLRADRIPLVNLAAQDAGSTAVAAGPDCPDSVSHIRGGL